MGIFRPTAVDSRNRNCLTFCVMSLLFLASNATSQESDYWDFFFNADCELLSGKNITFDFKTNTMFAGQILDETIGPVELQLAKHKTVGSYQFFLKRRNGGMERSQFIDKISYTDTFIDAVGRTGNGLTLKHINKNEWYGTTYINEFRDDKHVLFTQPLKCKALT